VVELDGTQFFAPNVPALGYRVISLDHLPSDKPLPEDFTKAEAFRLGTLLRAIPFKEA
jgi:hypothetical protein